MQKNILIVTFLSLSIVLLNLSCKKDSSITRTRTELLTQRSWILDVYRYNFNNGTWINGFATLPDCEKDNKLFFYTDFTFILDEGATKCNSSDPQIFQQGTWSFLENETKLLSATPTSNSVEITQLDETNFKTTRRDTVGTNITITEANYIH